MPIGEGEEGPGQTRTNLIDGNGQGLGSYVQKTDGFQIRFTLTKGTNSISGSVAEFELGKVDKDKGHFKLVGFDPADLTDAFVGGTLNIAGFAMTVSTVTPAGDINVTVDETPDIPFELADDDAESLPMDVRMVETIEAYQQAYIDVVLDGGGNVANNQDDVEFRRNISQHGLDHELEDVINDGAADPEEGLHQSYANRQDSFWVAYILMGWEAHELDDLDGENEQRGGSLLGGTLVDLPFGSIVYVEQVHDSLNLSGTPTEEFNRLVGKVIAHEIGHQFEIGHEQGALMFGRDTPNGMPASSFFFALADIARLRGRVASPGTTMPNSGD